MGSKCDRPKVSKDEKQDTSKEATIKKTPQGKVSSEISSQDKMLEMVMSTMMSINEKLTAMEERLSGLTPHVDARDL